MLVLVLFADALHELDLGDNKLLDDSASAFADVLRANKSLRRLSLRSNRLSSRVCAQFADTLRANSTLTELDLDLNQISCQDALRIFVPVLSEANTTLEVLQVGANIAHSCRRQREKAHHPTVPAPAYERPLTVAGVLSQSQGAAAPQ